MAVIRSRRLGTEEMRVTQRMKHIATVLGLAVGERVEFRGQKLHITSSNFITVLEPGPSYSMSVFDYTTGLPAGQLESFLSAVVSVADRAVPISLSEFKERMGYGPSIEKCLKERSKRHSEGFSKADPGSIVPF